MTSKPNRRVLLGVLALGLCISPLALAHEGEDHGPTAARADAHAPIAVMGDHMHSAGEWMISYRFAAMSMSGNLYRGNSASSDWIAENVPNTFFGMPGQPPTLRIVPQEMDMTMHMAGAMYAPTDWLTLMAMAMYMEKEMDLVTYQGMMGTARLGRFTTRSSGWGDASVTALIRLYREGTTQVHLNAGLSLPTGSITETDQVLTPMGMVMEMRLPYGMQLGAGTYDAMPGITYLDRRGDVSWGAQYRGTIRLGENDEGYALGDAHQLTAWAAYQAAPWISMSARLAARTQGAIDGRDARIMGPVQTADPENYGGEFVDLSFGVNLIGQSGILFDHRLAAEFILPLHQDPNGLQMERDWQFMIGYQKAF